MATIVDFRPIEGRSTRRPSAPVEKSGCEIVIFPGVRYERWETAGQEKASSDRRRKKRDRLELKD